jgi:CheY-like chemotaxis protein
MRVIIIDDSRAVQTIVRRAVQKTRLPDMEFEYALDGESALTIIEKWKPHLVLTDWHMPGMSGLDLLKILKMNYPDTIKVGLVTTESADHNIDEALRRGAAFVLSKPFEDKDLVALIEDCMSGYLTESEASTEQPPVAIEVTPTELVSVTITTAEIVVHQMYRLLNEQVRITPLPAETGDEIQLPSLVGLYAFEGTSQIRGLCVFDHPGMTMVGETLRGRAFPDIRKAIAAMDASHATSKEMLDLLGTEIPSMFVSSDRRRVQVAKSQVIRKEMPQLQNIMRRSPYRRDFALIRGQLPVGRLTLISQ